jgi:hypothetical protein
MASPFTIILYDKDLLHAVLVSNQCFELVDFFINLVSAYGMKFMDRAVLLLFVIVATLA